MRHSASVAIFGLAALTAVNASHTSAAGGAMRLVSYGYVDHRPRTATAIILDTGVADIRDIQFLRSGGEISPDGTRIAFDTCDKSNRGIDIARLDGATVRRFGAVLGEGCVTVRWSRDGSRLSYGSTVDYALHVIELDSGADITLQPSTFAAGWHSWSPSGREIVYETGRGGSRRLDIIDVASWRVRQLVGPRQFGACEVWAPDWSPAGDRIAFTSCDRKLYMVNADGSNLTSVASSAYAPRWSPDGASLLFLNDRTLMRVPADGGKPQTLGVVPYYGGPFSVGRID